MWRTFLLMSVLVLPLGAQAADQTPDAASPANLLGTLPIDEGKRSALEAKIRERQYIAAEELLAEEAKRHPQSQSILLVLAHVLFLDGKHLNTVVVLKKAERISPLDERSRYLLALSFMTLGRLNLARPEFETLAESQPSTAVYPYWLARIAYRKMDTKAALAHAQSAIRLDPNFMKAYDQLGLIYVASGNNTEAMAALGQAIDLNRKLASRSPWPSTNLGALLLRLERLEEAEQHLREATAIDDRFPIAHYRLGQLLEKKGTHSEAEAELQQAAKLDPTYPEPHYALARIYRQRADTAAMQRELKIFAELRRADNAKGVTRPD